MIYAKILPIKLLLKGKHLGQWVKLICEKWKDLGGNAIYESFR